MNPLPPLDELLQKLIEVKGSDLHLKVGSPPAFRIDGELHLSNLEPLTAIDTANYAEEILTERVAIAFEAHVKRRTVDWLTADRIAAISFTPLGDLKGIITPSGVVFERYHAGTPAIDPNQHRLMIHGMVKRPIILTMDDLMRFPSVSMIRFLECPANGGMEWRGAQMDRLQFSHGMLACCEWTGVLLSTLLEEVGLEAGASWILAEGADGAHMSRSIPMEKALDDALIVYAQNGEALRPEQGYPVRLLNPGWEGNTSIKWLRRLEVGDKPWHHREETSKYTDLMPDGTAREFTFVQECNSVVTHPCPEKPLKGKGKYFIEGLAWSGRGRKQMRTSPRSAAIASA